MAVRVATADNWAVSPRRQRAAACVAAAAADIWMRRRGPSRAGDHGSTPLRTVRFRAAGPRAAAAANAADPAAVRTTAVVSPNCRTSTILWTCTPVRSARTPRRRWAGPLRGTPATKTVPRGTSPPARERALVKRANARSARGSAVRAARGAAGGPAAGRETTPLAGGAGGSAPAVPPVPTATAPPAPPRPVPRGRPR